MRISIVTISYNQARYIERCIKSVISQDYADVEYIVVDPGSTDGSRDIIERYRPYIQHLIFEPDAGPADGLNTGFCYATGQIYFYLNADDELLPGSLAAVADYFEGNQDVDVIIGHGVELDENSLIRRRIYSSRWTLYRYASGLANAIQQATFFRASAFRSTGGFNSRNRTCWDGELLVDMALSGARIAVVNKCLGSFRLYPESISGSGRFYVNYHEDQSRIIQKILNRKPDWREKCFHFFGRAVRNALHPLRAIDKITFAVTQRLARARVKGSS